MKLHRVWAIARKELIHVVRDPRSLGMAIAIPMLLLLLFGYALTLDVEDVPLVVWDQSESPESRERVAAFAGSRYFSLRAHVASHDAIERAIDRGEALVGLVIPTDFARRLGAGRTTPVQLLVDGSDSNTATIAIGYAEAVTSRVSERLALAHAARVYGVSLRSPIDWRPRVWFNPDLESRNYIIPGLIAVIMMVIAALLTSLTIAREWERGTMEQLVSTPIQGRELIVGKLLPYFGIGMLDVVLAVGLGEFLFGVPLRGSGALLFAMAAIFLAGALSLGMLISILARNQLLASQVAMVVTFLPAFLLSGFVYAIGNMPAPIQALTHVVPARYFVTLLKGIYLKGVGLDVLALEATLLALFGVSMLVLANLRFVEKLV